MKIQTFILTCFCSFFAVSAFAEPLATAAATGLCNDGTAYTGASRKGACRGHKGVKEWYADNNANASQSAKVATTEAPAKTEIKAPANEVATGVCNDGSAYTGISKRGACRGHKGLKEWFADKTGADKTASATEKPAAAPAETVAPASAGTTATGLCKDGTAFTGAKKQGACRGHKGLKEWFADQKTPPSKSSEASETIPANSGQSTADSSEKSTPNTNVTEKSAAKAAKTATPVAKTVAAGGGAGKVWVNTDSSIYHCEGSNFYGKTKVGEYMTEAEAQAKGNVASRKKLCH